MQKKESARREERQARNTARAFRKVGGDTNVSEDEGDEEDESETVAAVNYANHSVSPPYTLTTNSPLPHALRVV
jgi:hypothetical protein